jgi:precorrin-2 C(20)-methyltransferase
VTQPLPASQPGSPSGGYEVPVPPAVARRSFNGSSGRSSDGQSRIGPSEKRATRYRWNVDETPGPDRKCGTLYGLGAGTGDPELLTLKTRRILGEVSVVALPRGGERSLVGTIVAPWLDPSRQQIVELAFSPAETAEQRTAAWQAYAEHLASWLRQGRDVAVVVEGDPSLYSSFGHLRAALARICPAAPVVVVPGVTAISAAAAVAGCALATRDETLVVVPATAGLDALRAAWAAADTLAVLKPPADLGILLARLLSAEDSEETGGAAVETVYVRRAGWPNQQVLTERAEIGRQSTDYFSLLLLRRRRTAKGWSHPESEPAAATPEERLAGRKVREPQ